MNNITKTHKTMKRFFFTLCGTFALILTACAQQEPATVYFTKEITPESLVKIYKQLGVKPHGRVAVKISTGEMGGNNYLKPTLIRELVDEVDGTIVECCTAYGGSRQDKRKHWETIHAHGFDSIAQVVLMDEKEDMRIPVRDTTWIKYDIVGKKLQDYGFMINLAHFKGHVMGGFGGVLKNQSIGVASTAGKAYIHSHGVTDQTPQCWQHTQPQDAFLESMAAAADAVEQHDLALVLARVGAQASQQLLVIARNDLFGNLHRQQAGVSFDFHLCVGGQRGEQAGSDQGES